MNANPSLTSSNHIAPTAELEPFRYTWPGHGAFSNGWERAPGGLHWTRELPESPAELAADSRWPALFPSPMCVITTRDGQHVALEREVGVSIVNRFPYVVALSFCRENLSARHHARSRFMEVLEGGGNACVQFIAPGASLTRILETISKTPDHECCSRLARSGLATRYGANGVPYIADSYLVYEARLVSPQRDFEGLPIYEQAWADVGSHRIYFLEITSIRLRLDVAKGATKVKWRALPTWQPQGATGTATVHRAAVGAGYQKGYTPNYAFPARNTIAFEPDEEVDGMAVKHLPPLPHDQVEVDNDRARWPCFFPSSCGLITSWSPEGAPNVMPCGSTTVVSRSPFTISPCVSYAKINVRYAARRSLEFIRRTGKFGCSVPYVNDGLVDALVYVGNTSFSEDSDKVRNSGLAHQYSEFGPRLLAAPIHFDCEVAGEIRLGTHIMFLGRAKRVWVRTDVSEQNPLHWFPWPGLT